MLLMIILGIIANMVLHIGGMGKTKTKHTQKYSTRCSFSYFAAAPVHTCAPVPAVEFTAVTSLACVNVSITGTQRGDTTAE